MALTLFYVPNLDYEKQIGRYMVDTTWQENKIIRISSLGLKNIIHFVQGLLPLRIPVIEKEDLYLILPSRAPLKRFWSIFIVQIKSLITTKWAIFSIETNAILQNKFMYDVH